MRSLLAKLLNILFLFSSSVILLIISFLIFPIISKYNSYSFPNFFSNFILNSRDKAGNLPLVEKLTIKSPLLTTEGSIKSEISLLSTILVNIFFSLAKLAILLFIF